MVFVLSVFAVRITSSLLSLVRIPPQASHFPQNIPSLPSENNDHRANKARLSPTANLCATTTNTYHIFSKSSPMLPLPLPTPYAVESGRPRRSARCRYGVLRRPGRSGGRGAPAGQRAAVPQEPASDGDHVQRRTPGSPCKGHSTARRHQG